jgi:hypothetical protein
VEGVGEAIQALGDITGYYNYYASIYQNTIMLIREFLGHQIEIYKDDPHAEPITKGDQGVAERLDLISSNQNNLPDGVSMTGQIASNEILKDPNKLN